MSGAAEGLVLHAHPLSSFCWKVLIGLHEAGLPFEQRLVNLGDPEARAAFLQLSPLGKMPALEDRGAGVILTETSLILEHLARTRAEAAFLLPEDWRAAAPLRWWDRMFDLYVHHPMQAVVADRLRPVESRDPFGAAQARAQLQSAYAALEAAPGDQLTGEGDRLTLADCAAFPALHYADRVAPIGADRPRLRGYLAGLTARPSVRRVLEAAQPYAHMYPAGD